MRKLYFFLICIILVPFLQGCPKSTPTVKEDFEINQWVYSVMLSSYLWSDEMPKFDNSGAETANTQDYFDNNLRYRVNRGVSYSYDTYGDRFSNIQYTGKDDAATRSRATTEKEYDFGFLLSQILEKSGGILHMQVLYVIPGAPADMAGIKRGDIFDEVNGTRITKNNLESLFAENEIKIEVLNRETGGEITVRKGSYYNDPILMDTIYNAPEKTAYLIYNHFTTGDTNAGYSVRLKDIFKKFKTERVETLILDLRYNSGGEIDNACLLASLIAPADMLGKEFMRAQRDASVGVKYWDKFADYKLLSNISNYNADIKNLYIITSRYTASASELIIHTLRPIFRDAGRTLRVIGETTYGKNVGSYTYTSSKYDWEISPICMRVYNLDKVSGYEEGLKPDSGNEDSEYIFQSGMNHYILPPFGDFEKENLLNIVVRQFYDIPAAVRSGITRSGEFLQPVPMIPERGLSGGVVLID